MNKAIVVCNTHLTSITLHILPHAIISAAALSLHLCGLPPVRPHSLCRVLCDAGGGLGCWWVLPVVVMAVEICYLIYII